MSMTNPQTIASKLHQRLSDLYQARTLDEVGLARLRADAEKLMAVSPADAHTVLAGIAALRFDDALADQHHRIALQLQDTAMAHNNYAVTLKALQRQNEAASEAAIASDMDPLNLEFSRRAILYLALAGRIGEAMQRVQQFRNRFSETPLLDAEHIPAIIEALQHNGVSEAEVRTCQQIAFDLLREKKIRPENIEVSTLEEDRDQMVSFAIGIDAPLETIMAMDAELGERIFQAWPQPSLTHFWLGFESARAA